jgi:glycosyltransferase involved in cell wall biosynthesis
MNQEYVILGWKLWKLWGKKIFLWRNHPEGNFFTRVAIWVSDKVFCTSSQSFTAKYSKTEIMPVGIDLGEFKVKSGKLESKNKILSLGRISPIKNIHTIIGAVRILHQRGVSLILDVVGSPINPEDFDYKLKLEEKNKDLIESQILCFISSVPNDQTPKLYNSHEIFVNLTPTGSMDKTIIEASSCGCLPVVSNLSLQIEFDPMFIIKEVNAEHLADALQTIMNLPESEKEIKRQRLTEYVKKQSLDILIEKLMSSIRNV